MTQMLKDKRVKTNRAFVNNLFPVREKFQRQELLDNVQYRFTDDINKVNDIVESPYKEVSVSLVI